MNSKHLGENISSVEVTHVSVHGIRILVDERELFLSYQDFPWFKDTALGNVLNIEQPTAGHFYWPDLDVDLALESIEHPERFPLISKEVSKTKNG